MTQQQKKEVFKYINAIRNGNKKVYADYYLAYKLDPANNKEPGLMGLSYMGGQAVRMNVNKILENNI
jgi:hypothetical protein